MFNKILVGIDFSDASKLALARGADLAQQLGAPLVALHVMEPPAPLYAMGELPLLDPAWIAAVESEARKKLDEWMAPYAALLSAYAGSRTVIHWGRPVEGLVEAADAGSLIIVGQVGHSTMKRLLFGSTASGVARHAPCDVLVVRAGAEG
ncbi:MAG TPA: universal stress protein [Holophagaceae bacterium]|nr:universal stress protein [Holophagaceae bacterium]